MSKSLGSSHSSLQMEEDDTVGDESPHSLLTQQDQTSEAFLFAGRKTLDFDDSNLDVSSDDDDGSSLDDDDESSIEEELTLAEKRKRNEERNARRHRDLFGQHFLQDLKQSDRKRKRHNKGDQEEEEEDDDEISFTKPRGMLFKNPSSRFKTSPSKDTVEGRSQRQLMKTKLNEILQKFPNREVQIRQLVSLFRSTIGQASRKQKDGNDKSTSAHYVPAPVFVMGPSGSGKTSIVRSTLEAICENNHDDCVQTAYVNCNTLEPATIGRLVTSIYNQLQPDEYRFLKRKRRKKRRRKQPQTKDVNLQQLTTGPLIENLDPNATDQQQKLAPNEEAGTQESIKPDADDESEELQRRIQPTRAAKRVSEELSMHNQLDATTSEEKEAILGDSVETTNSVEIFYSVVVALGRSLQPFFGVGTERCAFVVLDQGPESLMSLSGKKTNFLAELLLLPKVMRLNLTFVVVTKNSTLHYSRLNNLVNTRKCLATISSGLHPIVFQFPAYRGNNSFLKILKTKHVLDSVIGKYPMHGYSQSKKAFLKKAIDNFLTALVQFVSDSTRDMKDFIRMGRALWPVYLSPMSPERIESTIKSIAGEIPSNISVAVEADLFALLDQKFFQYTGTIAAEDITSLLLDSSLVGQPPQTPLSQCLINLPYFQSCLLLAAFICQHNRSDQDKKIFTAEGNGKRRKKQSQENQDKGDDEHVAFSASSSELKHLQSLRPRAFQVERVLSIFVTLVRLNPVKLGHFPDVDEGRKMQKLGSSFLYKDLAELIDLGYLHPTTFIGSIKNEQINFNGAKFWCSLTREEAINIAEKVSIPLDNYIV